MKKNKQTKKKEKKTPHAKESNGVISCLKKAIHFTKVSREKKGKTEYNLIYNMHTDS